MNRKSLFKKSTPFPKKESSNVFPTPWNNFRDYLISRRILPEHQVDFYLMWVRQFYRSTGNDPLSTAPREQSEAFLTSLSKHKKSWQIEQAQNAIELYIHFLGLISPPAAQSVSCNASDKDWKDAADNMRKMIRLKQMARSTERTYIGWLRGFYRYVRPKRPEDLTGDDVKAYLTHLAVDRRVVASTQNQALNALLFFYRHVLDSEIGDISNTVRAKRRFRLPVVLTHSEIGTIFEHTDTISERFRNSSGTRT